MTRRVTFEDGNWADLREPHELTGQDQEDYFCLLEDLSDDEGNLPNRAGRQIRDHVLTRAFAGTSYGHIAPPYTTETLRALPLPSCTKLHRELKPLFDALSGGTAPDPKTLTEDSASSPGTSQDSSQPPRPESPGEPSAEQ